ncbi:MAG: NADH-quinone oxidoreductase subunit NuoE [Planctomycetota bacterium]
MDLKPLDDILASVPDAGPNDLIPILQKIQQVYGYLPPGVLMAVSERTGIPASRIYGVATFYEQFHLEPHGRHTIRCCRGTACHVKGGPNIAGAVRRVLGVEAGQTTEDMRFTFETVACLGTCFLAPAMMVNNDYYGHLTAGKVRGIFERYA